MARIRMPHVLCTSALIGLLFQPTARAQEEKLGEVNFPSSCSASAQTQFNRAVAMLHSFFLPRDCEGVYCHHEAGAVMRHGILGRCHQPASQSAGRSVSSGADAKRDARPAQRRSARRTGSRRWLSSSRITTRSICAPARWRTKQRWRG